MSFESRHPAVDRRARRGVRPLWAALVSLAAVTAAVAQQGARRVAPAGIAVRFAEGSVHGFVALKTAAGAPLAVGDLTQVVRDQLIESRMVYHFADSSVFEEIVTFSQHGVFEMQTYHLVQRGPAFTDDLDATLSRSGAYVVLSRPHRIGKEQRYAGSLVLPPDVSNGMVVTLVKNLPASDTETVHVVAFTPQPRLIGLQLAPSGSERVMVGTHAEAAVNFTLKPKLGALLRFFANLQGKGPPDSHAWIVGGGVPAFVRFEGPLYSGPVWRIELASPAWPH
jgi:hypothetical protein